MGPREIYPNPPLALVVVELRHTVTAALSEAQQSALKSLLTDSFPLARPTLAAVSTIVTPAGVRNEQTPPNPRYMTRDNTASVTFRPDAIAVETTRYVRRSALRDTLRLAVAARQKVAPADGLTRIGVRYVNEVRADVESAADWSQWIAPSLTNVAGLEAGANGLAQSWQGMVVFGDQQQGIVLRHGNLDGYAVNPSGDLRRPTPSPGPYYLIDLDSYWTPEDETPTLDWDNIESHYDDAALSAHGLFEQLITDKYRQEVLRRDQ
ncbi:TIGR04255 family protein [Streptomyces sp. NPDC059524]|uniref:TIGR04255 family protein n=1 Tax=Streptomyces sp. NPDC059524 TaxID=3346856 RepID=UPI00369805AF